jgi:hypothetical protein
VFVWEFVQARRNIRELFRKNAHIKDPAVIDMLVKKVRHGGVVVSYVSCLFAARAVEAHASCRCPAQHLPHSSFVRCGTTLLQGYMEVEETLMQWKQKTHLMRLLAPEYEEPRKARAAKQGFKERFLAGVVDD